MEKPINQNEVCLLPKTVVLFIYFYQPFRISQIIRLYMEKPINQNEVCLLPKAVVFPLDDLPAANKSW